MKKILLFPAYISNKTYCWGYDADLPNPYSQSDGATQVVYSNYGQFGITSVDSTGFEIILNLCDVGTMIMYW